MPLLCQPRYVSWGLTFSVCVRERACKCVCAYLLMHLVCAGAVSFAHSLTLASTRPLSHTAARGCTEHKCGRCCTDRHCPRHSFRAAGGEAPDVTPRELLAAAYVVMRGGVRFTDAGIGEDTRRQVVLAADIVEAEMEAGSEWPEGDGGGYHDGAARERRRRALFDLRQAAATDNAPAPGATPASSLGQGVERVAPATAVGLDPGAGLAALQRHSTRRIHRTMNEAIAPIRVETSVPAPRVACRHAGCNNAAAQVLSLSLSLSPSGRATRQGGAGA